MKIPKSPNQKTSIDTNNYTTVENELVETSSKRHKTLISFIPQTRNTNTAILKHGASCIYAIIANNFIVNLKEFADPNWDLDIPSTMPVENIPGPYKQNMQTMFKFTRNN